eukprot:m.44291 g.44291  ORF g.44291 m.44291 type:complete len:483 (-) comp10827_c0_seq2:245-1693(-)
MFRFRASVVAILCVVLLVSITHSVAGDVGDSRQEQNEEQRSHKGVATVDAAASFHVGIGSCNKQQNPQVAWNAINAKQFDVFTFLGDNVYADTPIFLKLRIPASVKDLENSYNQLGQIKEYQELRQSNTDILATWDDHDYGKNDGDREYSLRDQSQELFLRFFNEPQDSPRWKQQGVWMTKTYTVGPNTVRIILLDNRSHKTPLTGYWLGESSPQDMLGADQWQFLHDILVDNSPDVTIIGSGLQVLAQDKFPGEGWFKYPASQAKLFSLLTLYSTRNPIFISGDVHFAELNTLACQGLGQLFDLTSSGMTHSWARAREFLLRWVAAGFNRVFMYASRNFGELEFPNAKKGKIDSVVYRAFAAETGETVFELKVPLDTSLKVAQRFNTSENWNNVKACAFSDPAMGFSQACQDVLATCEPVAQQFHWIVMAVRYFSLLLVLFSIHATVALRLKMARQSPLTWIETGALGLLLTLDLAFIFQF